MSTAATPVYECKDVPSRKIERDVFKLHTPIYQASRRGNAHCHDARTVSDAAPEVLVTRAEPLRSRMR
jgi:hypothetical protein